MRAGVTIIVAGLVQGVGFRYYVQRQAVNLNLGGFVKNLYNGDVEIYAEGDRSLLEELIKDVKVGPRAAHVVDLRIQWKDPSHNHTNFQIL